MGKRKWMVVSVMAVLVLAFAPVQTISAQQAQGQQAEGGLDHEAEPGLPAGCTQAVYTQDGGAKTLTGKTYTSTAEGVMESTVYATNGGALTLKSAKVNKNGAEGGDYGGQAVEADGGSIVSLMDTEIYTDTVFANGIWATEESVVYMKGGSIYATATGGHGVDVTKLGTVILYDVEINTEGQSASGALVNDAGNGSIFATRVNARTMGPGSSGFYIIGDSMLVLTDSSLIAETSEGGAMIYGAYVKITDSVVSGGKGGIKVAGGQLSMSGGSLTCTAGPAFYVGGGEGGVPGGDSGGGMSGGGEGGMPGGQGSMPSGGQGGGMPGGGSPSGMPSGGQGGMPGGTGGEMPSGMPAGAQGGLMGGVAGVQDIECNISITNGTKISATGNLMTIADDITGTCSVSGTELKGDVEAGEGCDYTITLANSSISGSIKGVALSLGDGSTWNVTGDSALTSLSNAGGISGSNISNITGNGHTVTYDKDLGGNEALGGKTYTLAKGGKLTPKK
jgi:hypothetical protein